MTVTEVETGRLRGACTGGVTRFLGIPFAAPPVGARRWCAPAPPASWTGIRDCLEAGPIPPQPDWGFDHLIGATGLAQSEDCLYLNVWTPGCDDARRPVMVWLYGGSFAVGTGASPLSDGARLARDGDVVVVTLNYRLGLLGFLPVGSILGERFATAANAGLLDVAAALRWVVDNIAAFGGDPDRVTVFGQSAGGALAALVLALPSTRGLVRRGIVQSAGFNIVHPAHDLERIGHRLLDALAADGATPERLYELPTEAFLRALDRIAASYAVEAAGDDFVTATMVIQPAVDGMVIPDDPHVLLRAANPEAELLIGTTSEELYLQVAHTPGAVPADEGVLRSRAARLFAALGTDAADRALAVYRSGRPNASLEALWVALTTDAWVHGPSRRVAAAHPGPTYVYRFELQAQAPIGRPAAYHGLDITFPWQTFDAPGAERRMAVVTDDARHLAGVMSRAWTSFAHTGEPAADALPTWPPWCRQRPTVMMLGATCRASPDPEEHEHVLWDDPPALTTQRDGTGGQQAPRGIEFQ